MTYVKICGITTQDDAVLASRLGADAIGLNFVRSSPRFIDPAAAREIVKVSGVNADWVGVFVNESIETILEIAETVHLNGVQLHGDETPEFTASLAKKTGLKVIKAFRISTSFDAIVINDYKVNAVLLDSFSDAGHGGTGEKFDWEIAKALARSHEYLYLAGGLNPENICEAIKAVHPYAVDVCSGVESIKGRKDPEKMRSLFGAINSES